MVLSTSNLVMTAEINEQGSRACKKLHYDETNNEASQTLTVDMAVQEKRKMKTKNILHQNPYWKRSAFGKTKLTFFGYYQIFS